jgi:hypothetical protein
MFLSCIVVLSSLTGSASARGADGCYNEAELKGLGIYFTESCTSESVSSSCDGSSSLVGGENSEKTWFYLIGKGLTAVQAAGAMGNLQHEGGFNPKRVEGGHMEGNKWVNANPLQFPKEMETIPPHNLAPIVSGKYAGQPGYGIVQWTTPGRKDGLQKMADEKKIKVYDLGLQLDYMWSELEGPYKNAALDPLKQATDLADAVKIWQEKYEGGANFQPRFTAAQDWLTKFGSGTTIANNGTGCKLDASGCPTEPIAESATVLAAGIRVHPCIAPEVERIMALAQEQGLTTFRGDGWVSKETQEQKRENNGCAGRVYDETCKGSPLTAVPGTSRHERGTAIDFYCDGSTVSDSSICFKFLESNIKLQNLPEEPWHWSIDGG